jgi:hypothetical protein
MQSTKGETIAKNMFYRDSLVAIWTEEKGRRERERERERGKEEGKSQGGRAVFSHRLFDNFFPGYLAGSEKERKRRLWQRRRDRERERERERV